MVMTWTEIISNGYLLLLPLIYGVIEYNLCVYTKEVHRTLLLATKSIFKKAKYCVILTRQG